MDNAPCSNPYEIKQHQVEIQQHHPRLAWEGGLSESTARDHSESGEDCHGKSSMFGSWWQLDKVPKLPASHLHQCDMPRTQGQKFDFVLRGVASMCKSGVHHTLVSFQYDKITTEPTVELMFENFYLLSAVKLIQTSLSSLSLSVSLFRLHTVEAGCWKDTGALTCKNFSQNNFCWYTCTAKNDFPQFWLSLGWWLTHVVR